MAALSTDQENAAVLAHRDVTADANMAKLLSLPASKYVSNRWASKYTRDLQQFVFHGMRKNINPRPPLIS